MTSCGLALFLLELHEGVKAGLTVPQIIAQMIQDDVDIYMTSKDEQAMKAYREERKTDKSALMCEEIRLLFEKEIGGQSNG